MLKLKSFSNLCRALVFGASLTSAVVLQAQLTDLSVSAQEQVDSLVAEKSTRTPAQLKINSQLLYARRMELGKPITNKVKALEVTLTQDKNGLVLVDINAKIDAKLLKVIDRVGGRVTSQVPSLDRARVWLPLSSLETVANSKTVYFIRPAATMTTQRYDLSKQDRKAARKNLKSLLSSLPVQAQSGSVNSEGDLAHAAPTARAGIPTSGLKIGVLSDSLDDSEGSYAAALASGDVPPVTVLPGQGGAGAAEGLAMLEIIYDLCPGAKLYFASAFNGSAQFAQNIRDLRAAGCDIIVDDVSYSDESPFFDDIIAQAVNDVTASGAFYFSSAANSGSKPKNTASVWEGDFLDGGSFSSGTAKSYLVHSFTDPSTGTTRNYNSFPTTTPTGGGVRVGSLFWNDNPTLPSTNDYDLFYFNSTGTTVIRASTDVQAGAQGQTPSEYFSLSDLTSFVGNRFYVAKTVAASSRYLRLSAGRGYLTITTPGQVVGHSTAVEAYCVAATPASQGSSGGNPTTVTPPGPFPGTFNAANAVEAFSSQGPRRIFFNVDGTAITPGNLTATGGTVRLKPDFTAADGVSTTLPAGSGLNPFYGTSAAAPHAAAIAGILLAKNPGLTAAQMRTALTTTAIDIEASGYDNISGYGILNTVAAVNSIPFGPGVLAKGIDYRILSPDGNGVVELGETNKLYVSLTNTGGNTSLTGVTASLTAVTPNVTVRAKPSTYASIAPGATVENASPYLLVTTAGFPLTGRIELTYTVSSAAGTVSYPVSLSTGFSFSQVVNRFETATPLPAVLPDNSSTGIQIPFTVSGVDGVTGKVTFSIFTENADANSSYQGDVQLYLTAPNGVTVLLKGAANDDSPTLGAGAADDQRCVFDDSAPTTLGAGSPPYAGRFKPDQPLSDLSGSPIDGQWTLSAFDLGPGDINQISAVSLFIQAATP